jgi:hypothetical protein
MRRAIRLNLPDAVDRPWALFEHDHPGGERQRVDGDERHRPGERLDPIGDAELEVGPALGV